MENKYIIEEVLDRNTQLRSDTWGHLVGQKCDIVNETMCDENGDYMKTGNRMLVAFEDNKSISTSRMEVICRESEKLTVKTMNRVYIFKLI